MPALSEGNPKTGRSVLTYSRAPETTCPGASSWCELACYAKRPFNRYQQTREQWSRNAENDRAPLLPPPRKDGKPTLLRIHVSGDFDTAGYIRSWVGVLKERPDVHAWAYTRSWRVPRLMKALEELRGLSNMQLFASVDPTIDQSPPPGWRVAFIQGDDRHSGPVCMEQTGQKPSCAACGYCFRGHRGNIAFREH